MTITRMDWKTQVPQRAIPVILVAGVPWVLTPSGVRPTTVSNAASADPLWWPGNGTLTETLPDASTFDPVRDILDPRETFEIYEKVNLLKGSVTVEPMTFTLQDTLGQGTFLLSNRFGEPTQLLAADLIQGATTLTLNSAVGFPASGIACIGRETVTYSAISVNDLTGLTRGKYGSKDRTHTAPVTHLPIVTANNPPFWQGRVCTMWLCELSADGLTISTPTLMYIGTVGAGVQMTNNMLTWSVPLDHITESLARKVDTPPISLYGYSHYSVSVPHHPLRIYYRSGGTVFDPRSPALLRDDTSDVTDQGGWHPSAESFFRDATAKALSVTSNKLAPVLQADGKVTVMAFGSDATPTYTDVSFSWSPTVAWVGNKTDSGNTGQFIASVKSAPEACFPLSGWVRIPQVADFATIPTTFTFNATTSSGVDGVATISLIADTDILTDVSCEILERDAAGQRIRITSDSTRVFLAAEAGGPLTTFPLLCTKRTAAKLGVVATGGNVVAALQAGGKALDALMGQDLYQSVVDWVDLERAFASAQGVLPPARSYRFVTGEDSFLDILVDELRLRGMCLAVRFGKLTGIRLQSFANIEANDPSATSIDEVSSFLIEGGREVPLEVVDNSGTPLASSMEFELPNGTDKPTVVTITDSTYQAEFGDGETLKCGALKYIPYGLLPSLGNTLNTLYDVAQQVLGPLATPHRCIRIPLTPAQMFIQPGDIVLLTSPRIPNWSGGRGVLDAACQVQEVRRLLFGGKLRATAVLRYQSGLYTGYAPEALVAPSGISGATVTLDTTSAWGQSCFAQYTTLSGAASTDTIDGFDVGDEVVLSLIGTLTPIADEQFTIISVNHTTNQVVLSSAPSGTMTASAAVQYSVLLRYAPYSAAYITQQESYSWVADEATQVLNGSDAAKRWAE